MPGLAGAGPTDAATERPRAPQQTTSAVGLIDLRVVVQTRGSVAGDFTALSRLSLAIAAGEFVAVVGRSGSGKTPLMNLMSGIERDRGRDHRRRHSAQLPLRVAARGMARAKPAWCSTSSMRSAWLAPGVIGVPVDQGGLRVDLVERQLSRRGLRLIDVRPHSRTPPVSP